MSTTPQVDLNRLNVPDLIAKVTEFRAGMAGATDMGAEEKERLVMSFMSSLFSLQVMKMAEPTVESPFHSGSTAKVIKAASVLLADFDRGEVIPLSEVGDAVTAMIAFHFDDLRDALEEVEH